LASIITESSSISRKTFFDKSGIFGKIHWGAEVMIWDQFLSGRPVATSGNRAGSSRGGLDASIKNCNSSVLVDNNWMAEVLSEQWSFWVDWSNSRSGLSVSPLASIIADSNSISGNTSLDESDIFSDIHWGAEVMIRDQFFTVRPDATSCGSAGSSKVLFGASIPNRWKSGLRDNDWMAEVNREQWFSVNWCG
jgi:hypothetical protein